MVIFALVLVLATYLVAFISALRNGYCRPGTNTLVLLLGAVLVLLPLGLWAIWWLLLPDGNINIGPSAAEGYAALLFGGTAALPLVVASLVYAIARMLRVRRGCKAG